jgi:hypothetical protein
MGAKAAVLSLSLLAFAMPTAAQEAPAQAKRSLMFTAQEMAKIVGAINDVNKPHSAQAPIVPGQPAKPALPNIYVSAVADYGSGRWTVWANGQRIAPGRKAPGFRVVAVRDDRVEILVDGDPPERVVLRPHQTWLSASDDIVEGIIP